MANAKDMVFGEGPLYPRTLADHGPTRSLAEVTLQLRERRLDLLMQQMDARTARNWSHVEWCGQEIAVVTRRLRMIDTARGKR